MTLLTFFQNVMFASTNFIRDDVSSKEAQNMEVTQARSAGKPKENTDAAPRDLSKKVEKGFLKLQESKSKNRSSRKRI